MSSWMEEYLDALEARDAHEKAQEVSNNACKCPRELLAGAGENSEQPSSYQPREAFQHQLQASLTILRPRHKTSRSPCRTEQGCGKRLFASPSRPSRLSSINNPATACKATTVCSRLGCSTLDLPFSAETKHRQSHRFADSLDLSA